MHVVQDLHVLRQPRAARPRPPTRASFLMTPGGRALRLRALRVRDARHRRRRGEKFPEIADRHLAVAALRDGRDHDAPTRRLVEEDGTLTGLEAYSASRPPHSEGLAVTIASYLAHETELPTINLLHLTSRKAVEAALLMARTFPHIDFRREVTVGHLLADFDTAHGLGGKVNPPLRPREDVEALWEHVLAGDIDWVVSDHACCRDETEVRRARATTSSWPSPASAAPSTCCPAWSREGRKRGLSYDRIARAHLDEPGRAVRPGATKGAIAVGLDADFCLVDDDRRGRVRAERLGLHAGVHAVRGLRADRAGHRHLPARRARARAVARSSGIRADSSSGAPAPTSDVRQPHGRAPAAAAAGARFRRTTCQVAAS